MNPQKFDGKIRALHWLMFVLFAVIFVLGVVMVEFKKTEPWTLYGLHKSLGLLVFLLVWLRLYLRWQTPAPPRPDYIEPAIYKIAHLVVFVLYTCMIIVPISGYILSNTHGFDVKFFGLPLPKLFPDLKEWEEQTRALHVYLAYSFLAIIGMHISAVVFHHSRGEEILRRMT
jgi:cytochrome b561